MNFPNPFEEIRTSLLDLDNESSLVRRLLEAEVDSSTTEDTTINLGDIVSVPFSTGGYETLTFKLNRESIEDIDECLTPLYDFLENFGISYRTSSVAIGEAVINAYVHGHKYDSSKEIKVHYKEEGNQINVLVEDQGGRLDKKFIPFLLKVKNIDYDSRDRDFNFYQFSGREMPPERRGIGTLLINQCSEGVDYHMSKRGGLLVSLDFNKRK